MAGIPRTTRRAGSVAALVVLVLALLPGGAQAAVKADYRFEGNLNDSSGTGPAMTALGDVPNAFGTETVNGSPRQVLRFACNSGVQVSTTGVIPNDTYSIAVLFRFQNMSGYNRIIDFNGGSGDDGLYVLSNHLNFYPIVTGSTEQLAEGQYTQVVLTRTSAKVVTGYVNGTEAITFDDTGDLALIKPGDLLRFFQDNQGGGGPTTEASSGAVARIRLFDTVLSASEVSALDDTPPPPTATVDQTDDCDTSPPTSDPAPTPTDIPRLEGDGTANVRRVAIQVCQLLFDADEARTVILARDDVFADALAGSPLAGDDSCVLYTTGGPDATLDQETRAEIDRALPPGAPVRILGGAQAVSGVVGEELDGAGYDVERYSGPSRYETAVAVSRVVRSENPGNTDIMLAWGRNFPDAVTGGAYGARTGTPILLTETGSLHPASAAAMQELDVTRTFVLGGTAVIGAATAAAAPGSVRVAGSNRMATAVEVAEQLWPSTVPAVDTIVLCNIERSDGWALTLSAAPLSARDGAPQLGAGTSVYPTETEEYLEALQPPAGIGYVMGNEDFISDAVALALSEDITPPA